MGAPESFRVKVGLQVLHGAKIRLALKIFCHQIDDAVFDAGKNNVLRIHKKKSSGAPHHQFGILRRRPLFNHLHQLIQFLLSRFRGLHRAPDFPHGLFQARPRDGLQEIVNGVDLESMNGILIVCSDKDEKRHGKFFLEQLLDHTEAIEPRHLHIQENQLWSKVADQVHGLQAIFPLTHDLNFREALQQERQLIARRLLVIHNQSRNFHAGNSTSTPGLKRPRAHNSIVANKDASMKAARIRALSNVAFSCILPCGTIAHNRRFRRSRRNATAAGASKNAINTKR